MCLQQAAQGRCTLSWPSMRLNNGVSINTSGSIAVLPARNCLLVRGSNNVEANQLEGTVI